MACHDSFGSLCCINLNCELFTIMKNKPRYIYLLMDGACQTLPDATPPIGKTQPLSEIPINVEPMMQFFL